MPDSPRTEPALCDHRQAPWLPLCEHAGHARATTLNDGDIGRRIETSRGAGVVTAVRHLDDTLTQVLLDPGTSGHAVVANVPAGEVVRVGWSLPPS